VGFSKRNGEKVSQSESTALSSSVVANKETPPSKALEELLLLSSSESQASSKILLERSATAVDSSNLSSPSSLFKTLNTDVSNRRDKLTSLLEIQVGKLTILKALKN